MRTRLRILALIVIGFATVGVVASYEWHSHIKRMREATYQCVLRSYSASLKPGTVKKDAGVRFVEDHLREFGRPYGAC